MGELMADRKVRLAFLFGLVLLIASTIFSGCNGSISGRVVLEDKGLKEDDEKSQQGIYQSESIFEEGEIVLSEESSVIRVIDDNFGYSVPIGTGQRAEYEYKEPNPKLFRDLEEEISSRGEVRLLIKLKNNEKREELMAKLRDNKYIKNYVSGVISKKNAEKLINELGEEDVERIGIDHIMTLEADSVTEHISAEKVWSAGLTGKRQAVCVIDSGIDYTHPALAANYVGGYDFFNKDDDPMDDNGHGTYVSGIILGIAPDAKIIAAKVFDREGHAYESDIIAAIDYCLRNKDEHNISVILMAFGGGVYNTSCYCDSNFVVEESHYAISQGLFAVAASGNDGQPYLKAPACGSNVTSVGAVDRYDAVAGFTNIEPLLDLLAPGVEIESANLGGGINSVTGTSASAAVVAGAAALLLEKETLAPLDLQYMLRSTGVLIQYQGSAYPRVDAYAALTNNVTNTPSEQAGVECQGLWEDYEHLLTPDCTVSGPCDAGGYCSDCCKNDSKYCYGGYCDLICEFGGETCSCDTFNCNAECQFDSDCGDGVCDTTDCTCSYVTNCSRGCFYIRNAAGYNLARFDSYGNMDITGSVYTSRSGSGNCTNCSNCLKIFNSTGACVAYFNHSYSSYGRLWLDGNIVQGRSTCNGTGFMIKNNTGKVVALINQSGALCLIGIYHTSSEI